MTMGTNWNQPDILSGGPILDLDKVNQRKLVWFILVQLGSLCEGAKCECRVKFQNITKQEMHKRGAVTVVIINKLQLN